MGKFHDDLVEARRRGEMLTTPEPVAPSAAPSAPTFVMPTFVPPGDGVPVVCTSCGVLVDVDHAPHHVAWHARIGS